MPPTPAVSHPPIKTQNPPSTAAVTSPVVEQHDAPAHDGAVDIVQAIDGNGDDRGDATATDIVKELT
jgi:hypothetical protein